MDFWYQIPLGGYRKLTPQGSATMHLRSQGSATAAKSRKTPRPDGWRSSRIRLHARYREWTRKESLSRRKRVTTRPTTPRLKNVKQNRPSGNHCENSRQWRPSLTRKVTKNKVNNSNEFYIRYYTFKKYKYISRVLRWTTNEQCCKIYIKINPSNNL